MKPKSPLMYTVNIQGVMKFDAHILTTYKAFKTTLCGAIF